MQYGLCGAETLEELVAGGFLVYLSASPSGPHANAVVLHPHCQSAAPEGQDSCECKRKFVPHVGVCLAGCTGVFVLFGLILSFVV